MSDSGEWEGESTNARMHECTIVRLHNLSGGHQAFEFLEPVENDNYFRRRQVLLMLYHQEALAISVGIRITW